MNFVRLSFVTSIALITVSINLCAFESDFKLIQSYSEENISGTSNFGEIISYAGDINGDGYSDFIVCLRSPSYLDPITLCLGGPSPSIIKLTSSDLGIKIYCINSAACAGDLNNDGYDDVIIGAYHHFLGDQCSILFGGQTINGKMDFIFGDGTSDGFGSQVSTAGDVNGDGFDDFLVYNPEYQSTTGRIYLYLGGSKPDRVADVVFNVKREDEGSDCIVSSAGDVNGDGCDDFLIYSRSSRQTNQKVSLYLGRQDMDLKPEWIFEKPKGEYFSYGLRISGAGDMNQDGYDDFLIGSPSDSAFFSGDGNLVFSGKVYCFFGGTDLDYVPNAILKGSDPHDLFGRSVFHAGDVNGDGYSDILIGEESYNRWAGRVALFLGGPDIDPTPHAVLIGQDTFSRFGRAVSGIGDSNGDGYDDLIIGDMYYRGSTGLVLTFLGGPVMDTDPDYLMYGDFDDNQFGITGAIAGDLNSDGFDDILAGATNYNVHTGQVYLYFGSTTPDNEADLILSPSPDLGIRGYGSAIARAGDLNGDGFPDFAVGSESQANGKGCVHVYFGGPALKNQAEIILKGPFGNSFGTSLACAGDMNGDGFDDLIVGEGRGSDYTGRAYIYFGGSQMDAQYDVLLYGEGAYNHFGYSVSSAGDVNKDGFDDIIVGAYDHNENTGRAYLYLGGMNMDNRCDLILSGKNIGDQFGYAVASAGDVNNDGYDDVIILAPEANEYLGSVYICYGGPTMDNRIDVTIDMGAFNGIGKTAILGAGDLNSDGFDDVIIGNSDHDSKVGGVYVYYGGRLFDNEVDFIISGFRKGSGFGSFVSGLGDVNGNGNPDIIIGAYGDSWNGKVYLFEHEMSSGISNEDDTNTPNKISLEPAFPNPFNISTKIDYTLDRDQKVSIKIFDISGRCVRALKNDEYQKAGSHSVVWDGESGSGKTVSSGLYMIVLKTESRVLTQKVMMIK